MINFFAHFKIFKCTPFYKDSPLIEVEWHDTVKNFMTLTPLIQASGEIVNISHKS